MAGEEGRKLLLGCETNEETLLIKTTKLQDRYESLEEAGEWCLTPLKATLGRQRQEYLCEFEDNLIYSEFKG